MISTTSGDWTSWMVIVGPILLAAAIAWALLRNRKLPKADLDRTEHGAHDRILEQDRIDKQRNHGKEI